MIKKLLVVLLLLVFTAQGFAQKVAGYFPSYRSGYLNTVQWNKLTDCYFAFINADANGNLITNNPSDAVFGFDMTTFLNVKDKCNTNNVKLHISVGGADKGYLRAARLKAIAANATARANFATKIVQFAIDNNLAGINIDWEFPNASAGGSGGTIDNHYDLINAVRNAINSSSNKALTLGVAVGGEYTGSINHLNYIKSSVVALIDEFHIMAYDYPKDGSLPYDANHHASITDANKCVDAWKNTLAVPYSKMLVGVPFYGKKSDRTTDDIAGMYSNFSNTNASAAYNDADGVFTSGGNTWYYDSRVTLETKITNAMSKGCLGVFAWDLGQDRGDQYSLLAAMRAKMNTVCPIPDPNLGPDKGFCTGSVVLDPGVAVTSGRTFTWQKDGADISGYVNSASANTYTASQAGVYKVVINQGSGCTKSSTIKVVSGSSVTGNNASRCGSGQVTLTLNNTTGTFDWYDAEVGGSKVLTGGSGNNYGRSYSPTVTATTDYYVQENTGSVDYSAGRLAVQSSPSGAWNEMGKNDANNKPRFAQKLTAYTDLTIKSVRIFTSSTASITGVKIVVFKNDGTTLQAETTPITIAANAGTQLITVNITLPGSSAGTVYYVGVYGANAVGASTNPGFTLDRNANASNFTQTGVYAIEKTCFISYAGAFGISGSETTNYGQLFDWTITTGVSAPCGRTKVTATVNTAPIATLALTAAASPICDGINGAVIIKASQAAVNYDLFIGATKITSNSVPGNGLDLSIPVSGSSLVLGNNTISAKASSVGCTDQTLTNTATITVNTTPAQPGSITGASLASKGQTGVAYTVTAVNGATSYVWSYSGTGVSFNNATTNSPTADFSSTATTGDITVKAKNACGESAASAPKNVQVSGTTSVMEMSLENGFTIYPNPLNDASVITISVNREITGKLVITDLYGNVLSTVQNGMMHAGANNITLPSLNAGMYLLKFESEGNVYTHKIVKNK